MRILTVDTANGYGSVATMTEFTTGWGYSGYAAEVSRALRLADGLPRVEPEELELPECGYELTLVPPGPFVLRTAERVCLGVYLDGRLVEVQGPVQS